MYGSGGFPDIYRKFLNYIPMKRNGLLMGVAAAILCALVGIGSQYSDSRSREQTEYRNCVKKNGAEIVTAISSHSSPGSIVIWKYNEKGGYDPVFEQKGLHGFPGLAVGDVDGDGVDDVVGTSKGGSYFITCKGGHYISTNLDTYSGEAAAAAIGDVDNDKRNEIAIVEVPSRRNLPTGVHIYRLNQGGSFEKRTWDTPHNIVWDADIGDVKGNGLNELIIGSMRGGISLSRMVDGNMQFSDVLVERGRFESSGHVIRNMYRDLCGFEGDFTPVVEDGLAIPERLAFGDLLGGGSRCIAVTGYGGIFQVIRHERDKGFSSVIADKSGFEFKTKHPTGLTIGDALNDGRNVSVVGSDRLMVYRNDGEHVARIWEGEIMRPDGNPMPTVREICIGDSNRNGMNEIIYQTVPEPPQKEEHDAGGNLYSTTFAVMENRGRGSKDFHHYWESPRFIGEMRIAVGDIDGPNSLE